MENKKLLKFLLKDLSELDELFTEKDNNSFEDLEMEFLKNRIKGAKKLVQILFERENNSLIEIKNKPKIEAIETVIEKIEVQEIVGEKQIVAEVEKEPVMEEIPEIIVASDIQQEELIEEPVEEIKEKFQVQAEGVEEEPIEINEELELAEEEVANEANQRLGDSFSKEKSVNDLITNDNTKLEYKLSNRPVSNIQSAIGINDRFQFIRELFDGNADNFSKTVTEIDSMKDIKEAVGYLQQNYKWKKNETSLKFVNLVKRRFSNE